MPSFADIPGSLNSVFANIPGFSGTASGLSGAVNQVQSSGVGDASILQLGAVQLQGFEIPRSLPLGGSQKLVVGEFVGNKKRTIQVMGAQPRPLSWSGAMLYESALARAKFFEALMVQGAPIPFVWADYRYTVVIDTFHYDPINAYHVNYTISLEIVQDHTDPQSNPVPSRDTITDGIANTSTEIGGIVGTLTSFISTAENIGASIKDAVNTVIGLADSVTSQVNTVVNSLAIQPVAFIAGLQSQALALNNQANVTVNLLTSPGLTFTPLTANATPATGADPVTDVLAVAAASKALANLLGRLNQPPFVVSITTVKDNVFAIASAYYKGDLNAWSAIADANGLTGARLIGPRTIQLPPVNGVVPSKIGAPGTVYEGAVYPIPPAEQGGRG